MAKKTLQTTVHLPREVAEWLDGECARTGLARGQVLASAIASREKVQEAPKPPKELAEIKEQVLETKRQVLQIPDKLPVALQGLYRPGPSAGAIVALVVATNVAGVGATFGLAFYFLQ